MQVARILRHIKCQHISRSKFSINTKFYQRFENEVTSFYRRPSLLKPFIFTISVGATTFVSCSILQYELTKQRIENNTHWSRHPRKNKKTLEFRNQLNNWWNNLNEGHKIAAGIIGINTAVFLLWQVKSLNKTMFKWFTCSPSKQITSPMLLSCFSHSELWHFGCNMFVLWSFAPLIHSLLGPEQFIAFYITGGTISSLASHLFKVAIKSSIPSLGASGALLAVLGACCVERPEARLSILFLPFFSFSAQTALFSLIAVDVTGLIMRWKLFDHAGHLGGTLFGSWYVLYGHSYTWDQRFPLIRKWHEFRSK